MTDDGEFPRSSFARTATERTTRPLSVERFSFGDLLQSHFKARERTGREGNHIVPIEAVLADDTQVLAAAEPRTNPPAPPIALDELARTPSVESIVASTEVTLDTGLPWVTELLLLDSPLVPQPEVFAALPNLHTLHAMVIHRQRKLSVGVLAGLDLHDLAVRWTGILPGDLAKLAALSGLRRLVVSAGPTDSVEGIGRLANLEYLYVDGGRSGWARLAGLDRLQEAVLWDAQLPDLRPLSGWGRLRSLWLRGRRVKSLDGIGALQALESAWLEVLGISDLAPLKGMTKLSTLSLAGLALHDLGPLAGVPSLRDLTLAAADSVWQVESLAPLRELGHIEAVSLSGVTIRDRDLSPLERLPRLRRLRLAPAGYLGDRLAMFQRARPEVTVEAQPGYTAASMWIGPVQVHPPTTDLAHWWILQELTGLLGTATNAEAEARLQQAIGERSGDLLARLRFDTEAGGVGVRADSETDIRAVADVIAKLAGTGS